MNYLKFLLVTSCLIGFIHSSTAQLKIINLKKINHQKKFDFIEIDNQGYLYLVSNDQIYKIDKTGKELYRYSNKALGKIEQLDVSNSLRPIVFYKNQALIVLLDNTLSQQEGVINLSSINLDQAACIANSNFDNGIWFYDVAVNEIFKINKNAQIQFRSGNLSAILSHIHLPIISIHENNGNLYAQTSNEILVFDQYGSLVHNFNIVTKHKPIYTKNAIIYHEAESLMIYEMYDFSVSKIKLNNSYDYLNGTKNNLVGVKGNSIEIFEIKN